MFAQYENMMLFYNSKSWSKIPPNLFKEFVNITFKKLGISEYVASRAISKNYV